MYRPLRVFTRAAAVTGTAGLVVLAGAGMASAHVTAQPGTAVKGSTGEITFRVPDEEARAGTVRLDVTLPLDHPIASVRTKSVPGWTAQIATAKLDKPVRTDEGAELTEAVRTVTWTANPGTRIEPGQFQEFTILAETMPESTDKLVLPATQTYDNGEVMRWDQPPAAPGAPEPEHPAPTVTLLAGPANLDGASATPGADVSARWLGGTAVVLGALGLGVAVGAVLVARRRSS